MKAATKNSPGDSGTFGTQAGMNAMRASMSQPVATQQARQTAYRNNVIAKANAKANPNVKAMITGSYSPPNPKQLAVKGIPSFKKGGIMPKTGLALLHKGEKVIPAAKVKGKKWMQSDTGALKC